MSKSVKRVVKNSFFHTVGSLGISGLNFLLILGYGRILGPEGFGSLATSQNAVILWSMFVDLGLTHAMIGALTAAEGEKSEWSRQGFRSRDLLFRVLFLRLAGAFLGTAILSFLLWVRYQSTGEFSWQNLAFTPYLFALAFQQTAVGVAMFRGRQGLAILSQCLGIFLTVAFSLILAFKGFGISWLLLSQSCGGFLAAAIIFAALSWRSKEKVRDGSTRRLERKKEGPWGKEAWTALFRDTWPYAITFSVFVLWQRLDQLAVSHFLGMEQGGQYAMAVRLIAIPLLLATSISFALFPDLQRVGRDAPEKVSNLLGLLAKLLWRYGILLAAAMVLAVAFFVAPLVPKFSPAMKYLPYFIPGVWAFWLQSFLVNALFGVRKYKAVVKVHLLSIGIFIFVLLTCTPLLGIYGVIFSFDVFCLSMALFGLRMAKRENILPKEFKIFGRLSDLEMDLWKSIRSRFSPKEQKE
jgi:O-antigen/teichoic acid export membrane protein